MDNWLLSITQIIYDGTFCCSFSQNSIFMFFLLNTFLNLHCKIEWRSLTKNVTNFPVEHVKISIMLVLTCNFIHLFWSNHHNRVHSYAEVTIFISGPDSTPQGCEHFIWLSFWTQMEFENEVHFQLLFQHTWVLLRFCFWVP